MYIQRLSRSHRLRACAALGNGLLNNLIAYWPGDELAGNALDVHTNALHLTDMNTVTSNPGHVYPLARQYTAANNEYHQRPGDDPLLSTGDVDFTFASWVRLDALGADRPILAKFGPIPDREYGLQYSAGPNRFRFQVSPDGTATVQVDANTFGVPGLATWYLVVAWHDSVADTINIQINNGGIDSLPHATGVRDGTFQFRAGRYGTFGTYMDGRIHPTVMWKSASGLGGVLSAAQRTALYNNGSGLTYSEFTY